MGLWICVYSEGFISDIVALWVIAIAVWAIYLCWHYYFKSWEQSIRQQAKYVAIGISIAMIFGPEKVIVVVGANKIVKDMNEAMERIHQVAAPMNAKRHYLKHQMEAFGDLPCVRTCICIDCNHDWSICHYTVIIDGTMIREKERINVILVGEELGI